jgi:hypothetical protein
MMRDDSTQVRHVLSGRILSMSEIPNDIMLDMLEF